MAKLSAPRHGSLGFSPRKRSPKPYHSPKSWPTTEKKIPGFAGYKAGMTHVIAIDNHKTSASYQQNIMLAVTIIECPPINVFAVKAYRKTQYGFKALGMLWADKPAKNLGRRLKLPKKTNPIAFDTEAVSIVRLLVHTNPPFKKKPEIFEIEFNGTLDEAKALLGKQIKASEVFKEGEFIDVIGVTKGKGILGPVGRWGSRIQYRKATGKRRHVGSINPWSPTIIMRTSLMAGQTGYHKRTEVNKRILQIGDKLEIDGGLIRYGNINNEYLLVKGSVPGPKKRAIFLREAIRPQKVQRAAPEVKMVSRRSHQ